MLTPDQERAVLAVANKPEYAQFRALIASAIEGWIELTPFPYNFGIAPDGDGEYVSAGISIGNTVDCGCLIGAALHGKRVYSGWNESVYRHFGLSASEATGLSSGFDCADSIATPFDLAATKCGEEIALALGFIPMIQRAGFYDVRGDQKVSTEAAS